MTFQLTDNGVEKINNVLRKKGLRIVRSAKQKAPVDTGRLRSSITLEEETVDRFIKVKVGTNVEYAPFVEFGTENQPAQPFLRPAARQVLNRSLTEEQFSGT